MPDNFGLLLNPVTMQFPPGFQAVIISAKGMAAQRQAYPRLVLPHMRHFMDKVALQSQVSIAKIIAEQITLGVEPQMAIGRHGYLFGMKPPPAAVMDTHPVQPDGIAKNRTY